MPGEKGNMYTTKTWTPAVPVKRPDNIVSSDYARIKNFFTPSYERECRPCMNQLIANEYQRIWWEEREQWAKDHPDKTNGKKSKIKYEPVRKVEVAKPSKINIPIKEKKKPAKESKSHDHQNSETQEKSES